MVQNQQLEGLAEIGRFVGKHRNTVRNWINRYHFPAAKLPGGTWATTTGMIETWLYARREVQRNGKDAT